MVNVKKPVLNPHRRNNSNGTPIRTCSVICRFMLLLYVCFMTFNLIFKLIIKTTPEQLHDKYGPNNSIQDKAFRRNSSSNEGNSNNNGIINQHPFGKKDLIHGDDNDEELPDRNRGKDDENSVDPVEGEPKVAVENPTGKEGDDDEAFEGGEENTKDEGSEKVDDDNSSTPEIVTIKVKTEPKEATDISSLVHDPLIKDALSKHGTGPAKLGYVVDLINERDHALFREDSIPTESYYSSIQSEAERLLSEKIQNHKALISCEYIVGRELLQRTECWDDLSSNKLFVYNPSSFSRVLPCKNNNLQLIGPHEIVQIHDAEDRFSCFDQPAHHFQISASNHDIINGKIVVTDKPTKSGSHPLSDTALVEQCDVSCSVPKWTLEKPLKDTKEHELYIAGTDWKIIRSMDDPYYSESSRIERTAFRQNTFYSTTSFQSSVPLSFFDFDFYHDRLRNTKALNWITAANKATYIQQSQCSAYRRNKWFAAVNAVFPVDSYGHCDHNTNLEVGETIDTLEGKIKLQQKGRISLVFESGGEKDYITETLWESLLSGSLPVILGPPNTNKHFPKATSGNPAAIYANNFVNWDMLAALVKSVSENQTLWESYHVWRTDEKALDTFFEMYNFTKTSPHCRLCLWAYAKVFGLGWDHRQQTIKPETYIPRQLCITKNHHHKKNRKDVASNDSPLVVHPFIETWIERGSEITILKAPKLPSEANHREQCHKIFSMTDGETIHVVDADRTTLVQRRIFYHDGVTDIYIDNIEKHEADDDIVLRLQFNIRNTEGSYFPNTHTLVPSVRGPLMSSISIQDLYSKVTVIANWETKIHSPKDGIIEIRMPDDKENVGIKKSIQRTRIRVITEDYNALHDKLTEFYPSHFGKVMTMDFIDPLEFLYEEEHR